MKLTHIIYCTGMSAVLFSCTGKIDLAERKMKAHLLSQQILSNEKASKFIEYEALKSNDPLILLVYQKTQELISFREKYFNEPSIMNLVCYSDSILNRYSRSKEVDEEVCSAIKEYQHAVVEQRDSISIFNLTWYTLFAEKTVLDLYSVSLGNSGDYFYTVLPTSLAKGRIFQGDTVLVLVHTFSGLGKWSMNFAGISCKNKEANVNLYPRVTKLGDVYLLRYLPKEKGTYIIHGPVLLSYGKAHRDELMIANEFTVK